MKKMSADIAEVKINNFTSDKFSISYIREITKRLSIQNNKIMKILPVIIKFNAKDAITFSCEGSLSNKEFYENIFDKFYEHNVKLIII